MNKREKLIYVKLLEFALFNYTEFEKFAGFEIYNEDLSNLKKAYWYEIEADTLKRRLEEQDE